MQIQIRDLVNPGSGIEKVKSATLLRLGTVGSEIPVYVNLQHENEKKSQKGVVRTGT
jgi:hypothetical protein